MAKRDERALSRRERQIMDVLYAKGQATALEVTEALPDPPSKTAVRTLLKILEEKGHLTHTQEGMAYVYRPRESSERVGPSALRRVLDVFFGGSLEQAVAAHLCESEGRLDDDELKRLVGIIQQARKANKEGQS